MHGLTLAARLATHLNNGRRKGGHIPREWNSVAWVAFQIRTSVELKQELMAYARETGQSQQAVVTQALEAFLRSAKDGDSLSRSRGSR